MRPQCVITGCTLVLTNERATVHGDLHLVGGAFVFNAVLNRNGDAAREHELCDEVMGSTRKCVAVDSNLAFERRGVFVFDGTAALPNKAALQYTAESFRGALPVDGEGDDTW